MSEPVVLARVIRSGVEESVHLGHVAVCDSSGRLLAAAGDPERILFARSSLKPLQAAVSLTAWGGPLDDDEVAIMCGSHSGERVHVEAVRKLLRRTDLDESSLRCPPAWPWRAEDARVYDEPQSILHNCSGKHAGMLVASSANGWDVETYLDPEHPLQRRIRESMVAAGGVEDLTVGVDGCGAPIFAVPLRAMATFFARLTATEGSDPMNAAMRSCVEAMRAQPYLVAGRDRLDNAVMEHIDLVVVKGGGGSRLRGRRRPWSRRRRSSRRRIEPRHRSGSAARPGTSRSRRRRATRGARPVRTPRSAGWRPPRRPRDQRLHADPNLTGSLDRLACRGKQSACNCLTLLLRWVAL